MKYGSIEYYRYQIAKNVKAKELLTHAINDVISKGTSVPSMLMYSDMLNENQRSIDSYISELERIESLAESDSKWVKCESK